MTSPAPAPGVSLVLAARDFPRLLAALSSRGYQPVGPSLRRGELILGELTAVADLPVGCTDSQEAGAFRLKPREDQALFGYGVGQQSFKQFLFPPHRELWQARREGRGFKVMPLKEATPRFAFIGVRPCDLQALEVQDRVFLRGTQVDPVYQARRQAAFIVAVNCGGGSRGTCFCVSMGTGPQATAGFDLALTEVLEGGAHYLVTEVGSERGAEVLGDLPCRPAGREELAAAARVVARAAQNQGRELDTRGLKELLYASYEHPRWDEVAASCLTCGNCTLVCPTCFCHTLEDLSDLPGSTAARRRRLDVCFSVDFSYIHGGSIRPSERSRYRQWLTHKLATWIDQFGCSGCVGCGRCITWCPVAIDITEEVRALRQPAAAPEEKQHGDH
jgi:sulfhydrogenase subunit beta (sulfur reductase)